jgi:uncharacterized secreted repeat protein (TIGR03808 family)
MLDRRHLIFAAGAAFLPVRAFARGADAAPHLQHVVDSAARAGQVVKIPAGVSYVSHLSLPDHAHLVGADKTSRLVALTHGPVLSAENAEAITIENLIFDGSGKAPGGERGLLEFRNVADLRFVNCTIQAVNGYGTKLEGCGGRVEDTAFRNIAESALFSLDGAGLSVIGNHVEDCGNNGIQIWRSEAGGDGTRLRGNHIARIHAKRGGNGPYGNGINVFRAADVICESNVISACGFSAIRYNASSNGLISANQCSDLGEVAIYVEFGSLGAIVQRNQVDGASTGISITNIDKHGRIATCSGNVVRNLDRSTPQGHEAFGIGIQIEKDTIASGNHIERAQLVGLRLGFGDALRNVIATSNVITDCNTGIDVTVVPNTGPASIARNSIIAAKEGAIVGMEWDKITVPNLIEAAARYPELSIAENRIG